MSFETRAYLTLPASATFATLCAVAVMGCPGSSEPEPHPPQAPTEATPPPPLTPAASTAWSNTGCTACHGGVAPIRDLASAMMKEIAERGAAAGDPDGCVVCHGGTIEATDKAAAHAGAPSALSAAGGPQGFYPDPGSPWINERTCGQCHAALVAAQWNSLMMTEAGKIQGASWAFGSLEGYDHGWSNYDGRDPVDPEARAGTAAYREYMTAKRATSPNVFTSIQQTLPAAPRADELGDLAQHPERAAFTYLRGDCQRCHLGVKGRSRRGDYRGMGCSACHIPYSNEGLYEGSDEAVPKGEPGHMLVHRIQGTRDAVVSVGEIAYSGIPTETCSTCHNRGKRIGVSYQGLMETAYSSPYAPGGDAQPQLHSKHYMAMDQDIHYQKGMLCQDCHTSRDVHGDGFIAGTNLGAVEIECTDCHGTPKAYPWELPLGYGDEDYRDTEGPPTHTYPPSDGAARGVARDMPEALRQGRVWDAQDGWILSARGNPMPEVVRVGDRVLVHTAGGKDLWLDPLKKLTDDETLSREGRVAMVNVGPHIDRLECYTCHASWAPQCYGCHVKIDYSEGKTSRDWVASGHAHIKSPEARAAKGEQGFERRIPGKITETRSYLRWEDPALGINGEARVTPLIPGCQVSVTVIGEDGEEIVRNKIFRTSPHSEGSGEEGQLGIDMAPVQPHTIGKSRSCESCHASAKALGYGIDGERHNPPWRGDKTIDLSTADGQVIPSKTRVQLAGIDGLERDWSALVTPEGEQLQTVGSHFPASGPLDAQTRAHMDRRNICASCHQEIPDGDLAVSALHHAAEMMGQLPSDRAAHSGLLHKILRLSAWAQVGGGLLALLGSLGALLWWRRRRRERA